MRNCNCIDILDEIRHKLAMFKTKTYPVFHNGTEKINPLSFNLTSQKVNYWAYRNIYLPQLSNAVLILNKE